MVSDDVKDRWARQVGTALLLTLFLGVCGWFLFEIMFRSGGT